MQKIFTPEEVRYLEAQAINAGSSEEILMEQAGKQAASWIGSFVKERNLPTKATIIAGKGNNGGDGYVVARYLIQLGFSVQVLQVYPVDPTSLVKKQRRRFEARSGKVIDLDHTPHAFMQEGVLIDALFGTGFTGSVDNKARQVIETMNATPLPVIAIDVPSGLDSRTGKVESVAVYATATCTMEYAKTGFFLLKGWDYVGEVVPIPIGLATFGNQRAPNMQLLEQADVQLLLPSIKRSRHKYQAGHVVGLAGSNGMTGAALLASISALRAGAGIVHLLHDEACSSELVGGPLEIVCIPYTKEEVGILRYWIERASALFLGPGFGTGTCQDAILSALWPNLKGKMVIDADALTWLASKKGQQFGPLPNAILTPHAGELERFFQTKEPLTLERLQSCQRLVDDNQTNLVLKGGPTFLFSAGHLPVVMTEGDPGMATAGSGDVLSGILTALLAQGVQVREAMLLGTFLHAKAGRLAAKEETSYCMIASSIIKQLPQAFKALMKLDN